MPVTVVVGAQWGDEGKGKIVDYLSESADLIVRFQGGPNAGHTIHNAFGEFKLHGVPSGIFNPNALCIVAPGCVLSPSGILREISDLKSRNAFQGRLVLSRRTHLIMPYHYVQETIEEELLGVRKIGTTGQGIGPCYADKFGRWGVRLGDLLHPEWLSARLRNIIKLKNSLFESWNKPLMTPDAIMQQCLAWREGLSGYIQDVLPIVSEALERDRSILLEGQLGAGKGVEWGCYPFVTSSSPTSGAAAVSTGIPPHRITDVVGVVKAYSSAVGAGPMPTRDETGIGPELRKIGHEYGATTGRPRQCGWLDALMIRHSAQINGFTTLAITRMDILDTFDSIGICTAYKYKGELLHRMPVTPILEECEPIYTFLPGWKTSLREIRTWDKLPTAAKNYVTTISEITQTPVSFISVGPRREETIIR